MDSASARGAEEEAEVWRRRLYRYLAGVLELDASAAADYHELQARVELEAGGIRQTECEGRKNRSAGHRVKWS